MSRNGSGTYSLPIGNPVITGTTISSTWANSTLTDIANALTGSLAADGQTTASGNLNMGTNKIINLAEPTSAQDGATKYYVDQLIAALGTMAYQNANNVAITGGAVSNVALDLHAQTGQMYLPVGNTVLRTASPIAGIMRYNTDAGGFYEGYSNGVWVRFQTYPEGNYTINYLVVAGGGGSYGGYSGGGGGGAGGLLASPITATPSNVLYCVVGAGGAGVTSGTASSITGIVSATGGGKGGPADQSGSPGGSGGGGGNAPNAPYSTSGGTGISGQGFAGGGGNLYQTGGGGGAAAVGTAAGGGGGNGGSGALSTITGSAVYYAGGGAGRDGGIPGSGGGGSAGANGGTNTGGGAGGAPYDTSTNGGSGVVILSIPTVNYSGTYTGSPTISVSGANTILKFTSSGTYTC
jgi:hypothetical protein